MKTSAGLFGSAAAYMYLDDQNIKTVLSSYTSNNQLKTIHPDWKGSPLDQNGRFMNHEFPFTHKFGTAFKWMLSPNPQAAEKKRDTWRIEVVKNDKILTDPNDKIVWLGHASFYLQIANKKILIDPVFGTLAVGRRYSEMPIDPSKFRDIDYVLVSHAHYDHCDKDSIKLLAKQNTKTKILTGLRLDKLLGEWCQNPIQAAGWYQTYTLADDIDICYVPSRHWANRGILDVNTTLWGGFVIKIGNKTVYFGGDSGYGSHFKDIGALFPNIDVALIGAGAYSPAWFMAPNHQSPQDALQAFKDSRAKVFVPFHYGTFDAADEPLGEPETILKNQQKEGKIGEELRILKLGEPLFF